jgi:hypothetical protein
MKAATAMISICTPDRDELWEGEVASVTDEVDMQVAPFKGCTRVLENLLFISGINDQLK